MKSRLACVLLLCMVAFASGQQITLFGDMGRLKFESYPLKVNRFDFKGVSSLTSEQNLRVCEALDNSRFVMFGAQIQAPFLRLLFDNESISASLRGVLERGGMLYFNPVDWNTLASLPAGMGRFFDAAGVALPRVKNYLDVSDTKEEKQTVAALCQDAPAMFAQPNDAGKFRAIRHFGDISGIGWKALAKDTQGRILAIYHDKAYKGTIVLSYLFSVVRSTESPFVDNILTSLYGPMKRQSARAKALSKGNAAVAPAAPMPALDLRKPQTVALNEFHTGARPKFATNATIRCENGWLYVHFDCLGGAKTPRAKCEIRDSDVWTDDCVEVFIRDSRKNGSKLYHFIVNSRNSLYDARDENNAWNSKAVKTRAGVAADGWTADLEISMAELGLGRHFLLNLAREETSAPEITSWGKVKTKFTVAEDMKIVSLQPEELSLPGQAASGGKLHICQVPTFTRVYSDAEAPEDAADLTRISFLLPRGDRELAQIVLYNYTDENMEFRLEPEFSPVAGMFKFYDVLNWRAVTGQVFAEIMAEPNSAGVISVPAGETKTFMVAAQTDAAPGKYTWSFELVPVNFLADTRKIHVVAEVLPLKLGEDMPEVYTFGPYGFSYVHNNPSPFRKLLQEAHVNMTYGPSVPFGKSVLKGDDGRPKLSGNDADYLTSEAEYTRMGLGWFYNYGVVPDYNKHMEKLGLKGYSVLEPEGAAFFESYVIRWTEALKRAHVDFSRFYVPLKDEPRTENIPELLAAGKILRKHGVRTCCTMATWSTLDDLRELAPGISLWIPWEPRVTTRATAAEELAIYKASGCPIMPYLCSMSGPFEPYQTYYRFRGIRARLVGAYSFSMWAANSWRGNPYRHADDKEIHGGFIIHHGVGKPVGTIRLEALREGAEDLHYVHRAAQMDNAELQTLVSAETLKKLQETDDPAATQAWRDKLVRTLSQASTAP